MMSAISEENLAAVERARKLLADAGYSVRGVTHIDPARGGVSFEVDLHAPVGTAPDPGPVAEGLSEEETDHEPTGGSSAVPYPEGSFESPKAAVRWAIRHTDRNPAPLPVILYELSGADAFGVGDVEDAIESLLKRGDIYEPKPDHYKLLEQDNG